MYCACRLERASVLEGNQARNENKVGYMTLRSVKSCIFLSSFHDSSSVYCLCLQGPEGEVGPVGAQGRPGADVSRLS